MYRKIFQQFSEANNSFYFNCDKEKNSKLVVNISRIIINLCFLCFCFNANRVLKVIQNFMVHPHLNMNLPRVNEKKSLMDHLRSISTILKYNYLQSSVDIIHNSPTHPSIKISNLYNLLNKRRMLILKFLFR